MIYCLDEICGEGFGSSPGGRGLRRLASWSGPVQIGRVRGGYDARPRARSQSATVAKSIGGKPRNGIAALVSSGATGGTATPWDPSVRGLLWDQNSFATMSVSGDQGFLAGHFLTAFGAFQPNLATIPLDQSLTAVDGGGGLLGNPLTVSPNPGRARAQVEYTVARAGRVRVELLDISGRVVETLADRMHSPGHYAVWSGATRRARLAPGLYLVRMTAPDQVTTRKLVMLE